MGLKRRKKFKVLTKAASIKVVILFVFIAVVLIGSWFTVVRMPGKSFAGDLPKLTQAEQVLRDELRQDVDRIAGSEIGDRNYMFYENLVAVANYLESSFAESGYEVARQSYEIHGQVFDNLEVEITGNKKPDEIVVIGAHYDSVVGAPGANDNGSGAAAVLALARRFAGKETARSLRFVEFVNEEPPFFWSEEMGSLVYAKRCRDRGENIVAMLSLETIGYYSDAPGSQEYPLGLLNLVYPITGNFIAFIGNLASGNLVQQVVGSFRSHTQFPSEGAAMPSNVPGAGWSDHWPFWQMGYPALMVTDTAPFRYPHYHTIADTPDKIDFDRLARVVGGIERVVQELANGKIG
jgi:hypothetical protein